MRGELVRKMEATSAAAARDKLDLLSEISNDFTSDTETSETYASYGAVNSVIDSYNAQQEVTADKLARCRLLLRQPYFAKVALQFKPGQPPKELYIGAAGISDDNYKFLVADWRSPVAETYYNQSNGATSWCGKTGEPFMLTSRADASSTSKPTRSTPISTPPSPFRTRFCSNRFRISAPHK